MPTRAGRSRGGAPIGATELKALEAYLESLPEPHILFDRNYRIAAANAAYLALFGSGRSVIGRTCYEVSHHIDVPCDQAGEACPLRRSLASAQRERVLHLHHTSGGEVYVNIELVPLRQAHGAPQWFVEKVEPLRVAGSVAGGEALVGRAPAFRQMLERVARVAPSQASVLLVGESGTGKELVARAVHDASPRAARALVVVDCASLPEPLFESELFGHEKGAFTGAHAPRAGLVEAAGAGTLFLDEVGDIPLSMQVKLLRLLENGTYRRVGSTEWRHADVRVVSATHRDLPAMVAQGRFREDLYHRLSTFPIRLPALRERREDISLLARSLLARAAQGRRLTLAPAALARLVRQAWPGNVRELRNVVERAVLLCDGDVVGDAAVAAALAAGLASVQGRVEATGGHSSIGPMDGGPAVADRESLRAAVEAHRGTRAELARALGMSPRTLYRRLLELSAGKDSQGIDGTAASGPPRVAAARGKSAATSAGIVAGPPFST